MELKLPSSDLEDQVAPHIRKVKGLKNSREYKMGQGTAYSETVLSVSESCKRQAMPPCFTALFPYSTIYTVQAEEKEFIANYIQISWKSFGRIKYSPIRLYLHFICRGNLIWPQDYKVSTHLSACHQEYILDCLCIKHVK